MHRTVDEAAHVALGERGVKFAQQVQQGEDIIDFPIVGIRPDGTTFGELANEQLEYRLVACCRPRLYQNILEVPKDVLSEIMPIFPRKPRGYRWNKFLLIH